MQGAGTSESTLNYSIVDNRVNYGLIYYRLKQVDFNGDFKYYDPVSVNQSPKGNKISVYPNPSINFLHIANKNTVDLQAIKLFKLNGENVLHKVEMHSLSKQKTLLNLTSLPNGIYILLYKEEVVRIIKS